MLAYRFNPGSITRSGPGHRPSSDISTSEIATTFTPYQTSQPLVESNLSQSANATASQELKWLPRPRRRKSYLLANPA